MVTISSLSRNWRGNIRQVAMLATGALAMMCSADAPAQTARKVPYWASVSETEARMRVGPSLDYPASWVYRRRDLPVRVIQTLNNWRKVEDSTGTQGWMHVRLLSDTATAIVTGETPSPMYEGPDDKTRILYRAEPGVVGRVSDCARGFCAFDVLGQRGYVAAIALWGAVK